jgi:hypothetical protein
VTRWQGRIPLFVGVTGHRDLHPEDVPAISRCLRTFFQELRATLPNTPIVVLSKLAEGADQLAASIAIDSGLESACVLPFEISAYRAAFRSEAARLEFDRLLSAGVMHELPDIVDGAENAAQDYARAGHYIARHAMILLALWDGAQSTRAGSTADVVHTRATGWVGPGVGIVYHLPVRRRERERLPLNDGGDKPEMRAAILAGRFQSVSALDAIRSCGWSYAEEFNTEVLAGIGSADAQVAQPFAPIEDPRFADVAAVLAAARSLSADAQRAVRRRKTTLQIIVFFAAIAFAVAFNTRGDRILSLIYLGLLGAALVLRTLMRREAVHRRYLDYRCLTEGLRVALFWRLAGVHSDPGVHTVTVRLISRQDPSLTWIASALSGLAGWIGLVHLPPGFDGCGFAAEHWLGSSTSKSVSAQIPYYRRASRRRRRVATWLDRIAHVALICGVATAASLAMLPAGWVGEAAPFLLAFMGILPLISNTASSIADLPAEFAVARQYEGMADLLQRAAERFQESGSDAERREILFEVGTAALAEHSFWHTVFREKAPESRIRI